MSLPYLIPDTTEDEDEEGDAGGGTTSGTMIAATFAGVKQKTNETLYPSFTTAALLLDKSPKGSVDAHIATLVDLVNAHPSFATLSSCAGRIALYDPAATVDAPNVESDENDSEGSSSTLSSSVRTTTTTRSTVKGNEGSGWRLVSHDELPTDALEQALDDAAASSATAALANPVLFFKMEPFVLHVAARTLYRGQQLLQLALASGLRESGLVVTERRVTIQIRSAALAVSVPVTATGPLRPSSLYLRALLQTANERLRRNLVKLETFQAAVQRTLFVNNAVSSSSSSSSMLSPPHIYIDPMIRYDGATTNVPDLRLWGATAVLFPATHDASGSTDLLVMGGYGTGPAELEESGVKPELAGLVTQTAHMGRSRTIYRLCREEHTWLDRWEAIELDEEVAAVADEEIYTCWNVPCRPVLWHGRESAAACVVVPHDHAQQQLVLVFGGRLGPAHPLNDLLLYDYANDPFTMLQPADLRGAVPSPRWGHSLSAMKLDGNDNNIMAVLVGGRNEAQALDGAAVHVVRKCGDDDDAAACFLQWETIEMDVPLPPRFHHASIVHEDKVFVFGGMSSATNILQKGVHASMLSIDLTRRALHVHEYADKSRFGHTAVTVAATETEQMVLMVGGLPVCLETNDSSPFSCCRLRKQANGDWRPEPSEHLVHELGSADFGALIHHSAFAVAVKESSRKRMDVIVVGGGVSGYSFNPCFARSHLLRVVNEPEHVTPLLLSAAQQILGESNLVRPLPRHYGGQSAAFTPDDLKDKQDALVSVLFVNKQQAKALKSALEYAALLDKSHRMAPADSETCPLEQWDECIAVPITRECKRIWNRCAASKGVDGPPWRLLVEGSGEQVLPLSTAMFARHEQ